MPEKLVCIYLKPFSTIRRNVQIYIVFSYNLIGSFNVDDIYTEE